MTIAALAIVLAGGVPAAQAAAQRWTAASNTAMAITGDIQLSDTRLTFKNGRFLPLALVDHGVPFKDDIEGGVKADIYAVSPPDDPKLLRGNRLCGGTSPTPVTFVVTWRAKADGSLWIAPSAKAAKPASFDDVCGSFNYVPRGH